MSKFQAGDRIRVVASGQTGVILIRHDGTLPPLYTARLDLPLPLNPSLQLPAERDFLEYELELDEQ